MLAIGERAHPRGKFARKCQRQGIGRRRKVARRWKHQQGVPDAMERKALEAKREQRAASQVTAMQRTQAKRGVFGRALAAIGALLGRGQRGS